MRVILLESVHLTCTALIVVHHSWAELALFSLSPTYGLHNIAYGLHNIAYGLHNITYGLHNIAYGLHNTTNGLHNIAYGLHNIGIVT